MRCDVDENWVFYKVGKSPGSDDYEDEMDQHASRAWVTLT